MNRRTFLKWVGVGTVAVVVAPAVLLSKGPVSVASEARGYQYADYTNFSEEAHRQYIDQAVSDAAREFGHRAGKSIEVLYAETA